MARYHFNIMDGRPRQDVDGTECPTIAHARREAVRHIGQLLMTQPRQFWDGRTWSLEAVLPGRGVVFQLRFSAETLIPDDWLE
jgi:hypothetical protein